MGKLKVIFTQALMISTAILFGLGVKRFIDYLVNNETFFTWPWYMPFSIVFAGFLCAFASLIIMNIGDANGKKTWIKIAVHFLCVWAVLSVIGYLFNWYETALQYLVVMIMYVIIYVFVWLCTWWMYMTEDKKINEKIKDMQDEE